MAHGFNGHLGPWRQITPPRNHVFLFTSMTGGQVVGLNVLCGKDSTTIQHLVLGGTWFYHLKVAFLYIALPHGKIRIVDNFFRITHFYNFFKTDLSIWHWMYCTESLRIRRRLILEWFSEFVKVWCFFSLKRAVPTWHHCLSRSLSRRPIHKCCQDAGACMSFGSELLDETDTVLPPTTCAAWNKL